MPTRKSSSVLKKWLIPAGLLFILYIAYTFINKTYLTAATVNGQPISRYQLVKELETKYGQPLLDQKIIEALIFQESRKQSITVPQEEIDTKISEIEKQVAAQGQDLDNLLSLQNMTKADLAQQINTQIMVEKLAPKPDEPSEEEITEQLKQQADSFTKEMSEADRRAAIIDKLKNEQQSTSIQDWLQSLRDSANIQYLQQY